jgi:hypothetical protein
MFHPPAFVDDLNESGLQSWHERMVRYTCRSRQWVLAELRLLTKSPTLGEEGIWYADPEATPPPEAAQTDPAPWGGFPAQLRNVEDLEERWKSAESVAADGHVVVLPDGSRTHSRSRVNQDEYLEWHADTVDDQDGQNVARVHFTCEGPEYWEELAQQDDMATLHALYEQHLGRKIPIDDLRYPHGTRLVDPDNRLFPVGGEYDPYNDWNTVHGAMHLTQVNNTLGAEVNLAARATIPRQGFDDPLGDPEPLATCGGFGDSRRDSDPHIGAAANAFVLLSNHIVTLTNPIGLYIAGFGGDQLTLPDDPEKEGVAEVPRDAGGPGTWFRAVRPKDPDRGGHKRILRAVFEPPEGAMFRRGDLRRPLRVSDLRLGPARVTRGAALAQLVRMHLLVDHWPAATGRTPRVVECWPEQARNQLEDESLQACEPQLLGIIAIAPHRDRFLQVRV